MFTKSGHTGNTNRHYASLECRTVITNSINLKFLSGNHSGLSPKERVINVSVSGGDFSTIQAAITAASAGTFNDWGVPSSTNRYIIQVAPGTYPGGASFITLVPYVTVRGYAFENINLCNILITDRSTGYGIKVVQNSVLENFNIRDTGTGAVSTTGCVYIEATTGDATIRNINIISTTVSGTCITVSSNSNSNNIFLKNIYITCTFSGTVAAGTVISNVAGSLCDKLSLTDVDITCTGTNVTTLVGIDCNGIFSTGPWNRVRVNMTNVLTNTTAANIKVGILFNCIFTSPNIGISVALATSNSPSTECRHCVITGTTTAIVVAASTVVYLDHSSATSNAGTGLSIGAGGKVNAGNCKMMTTGDAGVKIFRMNCYDQAYAVIVAP